ncbi:uncharacterized protein LOC116287590 [Actinia tenebrosa]|uniref:Uncharacterized protein LOC116287590 n=1 Tax=Actinia tenebrosa TaxID=6105 RepID=A0A6P8H155_ACTTE|nr:uncharacterized protein LOC116287590 [Actinia tenebrosa]
MEKSKASRRKSRPVSELITLFDHQQAEETKGEQWKSENALNLIKSPKTHDKEKPTKESNLFGNSVMSKSSDSVFNSDLSAENDKKLARGEALGKTSIILTLRPQSGTEKTKVSISSIEPNNKNKKSKKKLEEKEDSPMEVPNVLQEEMQGNDKTEDDVHEDEAVENDESCNRKKYPLDDSLAVLRREMHSLRKQDVELMTQLLALNSSIQKFKSSSSSISMSNFSDISDAETDITEIEAKPSIAHACHQRESSGSDASDFESRGYEKHGRSSKYTNVKRDSNGSDISGYYSNASPYGSNRSLNGYDVNGSDYPSTSIVIGDDLRAQQVVHRRQKQWWNQNVVTGNARSGSDSTLSQCFPETGGATLYPAVQSRNFFPGDERVKRISLQQKRINNRRHSAMGPQSLTTSLTRSESDQSINGCDVTSNPISGSLQKWQRSRSSCALNRGYGASSPVQNTIKVDLRHNPPMPGTAIELVLPIQPLAPTRRNSAVRMAERKPLTKLNTLSKRQSMIW